MGRMRVQSSLLAVLASVLLLAHCGGEIAAPRSAEAPPASLSTPDAAPSAPYTWVSCLPPQEEPPTMPLLLCPSPAPGQYTLTISERELTPKIAAAIAASDDEGEVSGVVLVFEPDVFTIRGRLERPFRATIQVSGSLVVRNGRLEVEGVKGRFGFIAVPAWYIAEASAEVNEQLDIWFRTEYGIRVTHVAILPGQLHLTGEKLR